MKNTNLEELRNNIIEVVSQLIQAAVRVLVPAPVVVTAGSESDAE